MTRGEKATGVLKYLGAASAIVALILALSAASRAFGEQAQAVGSLQSEVKRLDDRKADREVVDQMVRRIESSIDSSTRANAESHQAIMEALKGIRRSNR